MTSVECQALPTVESQTVAVLEAEERCSRHRRLRGWQELNMRQWRYYQVLNAALDQPEMAERYPALVLRLRRQRQAERDMWNTGREVAGAAEPIG